MLDVSSESARQGSHPRRWVLVGGIVFVAIAVTAGWLVRDDAGRTGRETLAKGKAVAGGDTGWPTDVGPVSMQVDQSLWTGTDVVLIGRDAYKVGSPTQFLAFTPASTEWSKLPNPPISEPLSGLQAVWTGKAIIVVGVRCSRVLDADSESGDQQCAPGTLWAGSLDPKTGIWTALDAPPVPRTSPRYAAFGQAIGWDGRRAVYRIGDDLWAWNPTGWVQLPNIGLGAQLCISHDRLVAVRSALAGPDVPDLKADAGRFTTSYLGASDTEWKVLPAVDAPVFLPDGVQMQCSATSVLLSTRGLDHVWLLDATDRWQDVPPPERALAVDPFPVGRSDPSSSVKPIVNFTHFVWTGREFFWWQPRRAYEYGDGVQRPAWPGVGLTLDPKTLIWRSTKPGPAGGEGASRELVWSDGVGYLGLSGMSGTKVAVAEISATPAR